jgi:hypothetical protein
VMRQAGGDDAGKARHAPAFIRLFPSGQSRHVSP